MTRMKDDERRIREAISSIGHQPIEGELLEIATDLKTPLGRVKSIARRLAFEATPKRALTAENRRGRNKEVAKAPKKNETSNAVSGQQKSSVAT